MFKKYKAVRVTVVILSALSLLAGSTATATAAKNFKNRPKALLWVQPMTDHPVHRLMQAGFLIRCKQLGYTCKVVGNPSATVFDEAASIPLVDAELAARKYGGVAVYQVSPPLWKLTNDLAKKGYPIVGWHAMPDRAKVPGLLASAAQNIPDAGTGPADAICKIANNVGTVAITEGSLNDEENLKAASFKSQLAKKCPAMKVTDIGIEGFDSAKAIAIAAGMLAANPDIVAAYSTTGNGAQTWSLAAAQTSRKITIIGMDYIRQNLDLIRDGKVYAVVGQPLYEESAMVVDIFDAIFKGKKYVYKNIIPAKLVTKANVNKYYAILKKAGQ
jgi:ribose transport system substrate-binding protein